MLLDYAGTHDHGGNRRLLSDGVVAQTDQTIETILDHLQRRQIVKFRLGRGGGNTAQNAQLFATGVPQRAHRMVDVVERVELAAA